MLDFLGIPVSLPTVGGWGAFMLLAAGIVRALIRGDLVPRSVLEDVRKDRDARLSEAGAWKHAWEEQNKLNDILVAQNVKLTVFSEVGAHVLTSLPTPEKEGDSVADAPSP